jgi:hypothetical protein
MNELDNMHEDSHMNVDKGENNFSNLLMQLTNIGSLKYKHPNH